jgi:hypothetical protein
MPVDYLGRMISAHLAKRRYSSLTLIGMCLSAWFCFGIFEPARAQRRTAGPLPTAIERLCFASEVFVATVSSAVSSDCRLKYPTSSWCEPRDQLTLTLIVDEPLITNEEELSEYRLIPLRQTDTINVFIKYHRKSPYYVEGGSEREDESFMGRPMVDLPPDQRLSDQQINEQFVGQKFIFGTRRYLFHKDGSPFAAYAWPLRLRPWAEENLPTVALRHCSRSVRPVASP